MLCVECGAEVPKTIQGSCPACFTKATALLRVSDVLDVELCAHCDARHVGAHWVDPQDGMPLEWVREEAVRAAVSVHERVRDAFLQFDETAQDEKHFRYDVQVEGSIEEVPVEAKATLLVRQRKGVCDRCSRMFGNYFAAIIQLRATERDVTEAELQDAHDLVAAELERQREGGNRFSFITKHGGMHGGWDYYVGDIEAARQVARQLKQRLGAQVQETAKLVGRQEGDNVHRVTFLVRIRLFATGDYAIGPQGILLQVQSVSHGKAICTDLIYHRRTRVEEGDLKRIGGPELIIDAILVSTGDTDLQVMDPVSYRTQDVLRPEGYVPTEETVRVLRYEERLYLVPEAMRTANKS